MAAQPERAFPAVSWSDFTPDVHHHWFCPVFQLFGWEELGPLLPWGWELTSFTLIYFRLLLFGSAEHGPSHAYRRPSQLGELELV